MSIGEHLEQFLKVMDDLENFVESSKFHFLGKVLVDEESFFTLFNKLRMALPRELKEMEMMFKEAQRIRQATEAEAKKIIENAQEYARALVEDHEIKRRADQRADEIKLNAEKEAEAIKEEGRRYARQVFEKMLAFIEQVSNVSQEALKNLS